jgi:hypothetical protein
VRHGAQERRTKQDARHDLANDRRLPDETKKSTKQAAGDDHCRQREQEMPEQVHQPFILPHSQVCAKDTFSV